VAVAVGGSAVAVNVAVGEGGVTVGSAVEVDVDVGGSEDGVTAAGSDAAGVHPASAATSSRRITLHKIL
jgi:hypothetical protein